ncbi:MAG: hypothetical protein HRT87_01195 [Legionellales bacterium]|nr:hypothetical protein [Legionellales bacterium]
MTNKVIELKKLKDNGTLDFLLKNGFIPFKVLHYLNIYDYYNHRLEANKHLNDTISQTLFDSADQFNCSEQTIRYALKALR